MSKLERATCSYVKGVRGTPKEFSEKFFGDRVVDYAASCSMVKEHNWEEILDECEALACDPEPELSENEMADISHLDRQRGMLFEFSSPAKA